MRGKPRLLVLTIVNSNSSSKYKKTFTLMIMIDEVNVWFKRQNVCAK
ncbi:hypothetical protein B4134_1372 [Bacillus safensis]|nr:hypothetical protein B4134_1372 [Bacillus safensis]